MNWLVIEKKILKICYSDYKPNYRIPENQEQEHLEVPTPQFKEWIQRYIEENYIYEKERMFCVFCHERITDFNYVVIDHPYFPKHPFKKLFCHSNRENCISRINSFEKARRIWLRKKKGGMERSE